MRTDCQDATQPRGSFYAGRLRPRDDSCVTDVSVGFSAVLDYNARYIKEKVTDCGVRFQGTQFLRDRNGIGKIQEKKNAIFLARPGVSAQ